MKTMTVMTTLVLLSSLLAVQGCTIEPMGESKANLVQAQTLDPDAGKQKVSEPNPVAGREVQKAIAMPGQETGKQQQSGNSTTILIGNN